LTKIVVVVDDKKEIFEGTVEANTLQLDVWGNKAVPILTIYELDSNSEPDKEIASFKHWTYWRYTK